MLVPYCVWYVPYQYVVCNTVCVTCHIVCVIYDIVCVTCHIVGVIYDTVCVIFHVACAVCHIEL